MVQSRVKCEHYIVEWDNFHACKLLSNPKETDRLMATQTGAEQNRKKIRPDKPICELQRRTVKTIRLRKITKYSMPCGIIQLYTMYDIFYQWGRKEPNLSRCRVLSLHKATRTRCNAISNCIASLPVDTYTCAAGSFTSQHAVRSIESGCCN